MSEKDYNPNMHTLEHLLNGTISKMFNCGRAFSTHVERKKSKIDYRFDRNFTADEVAQIEKVVNDIISKDVQVTEDMLPIAQAREQFDLSRLPDGVDSALRIIRLGEFDSCPCIGGHVSKLSEIGGLLRIVSTDHNTESGVLRIRFKILK